MKVFLDTNVIVSAVATRGLCADLFRVVLERHDLIISEQLLQEVSRTLARKFSAPAETIADLLDLLRHEGTMAEPTPLPALHIRDEDDVSIIGAAIASKAEVLVTGDGELLGLAEIPPLRILSTRAFWEILAGRGNTPGEERPDQASHQKSPRWTKKTPPERARRKK
jgi:putative PIN family toxin of toxin-antitoxin system